MYRSLAAAFVTLHLFPARIVSIAGCTFLSTQCTGSTITGSRSANAAARIPIRDAVIKAAEVIESCAYRLPSGFSFPVQAYVDNLYVGSKSDTGCARILQSLQDILARGWLLYFGDDTKFVLPCAGAQITTTAYDREKWPSVSTARVLGYEVSSTANVNADVECVFRCMWTAFFRCNCNALALSSLGTKLKRLDSCILSRVLSKMGLWRFTDALAKRIDRLQSYLLAGCLRFPRRPVELEENYYRRRAIFAGKACKKHGLWSLLFAKNIVRWHSHCLRASTRDFLRQRRRLHD